jgi:hypothetical protein
MGNNNTNSHQAQFGRLTVANLLEFHLIHYMQLESEDGMSNSN